MAQTTRRRSTAWRIGRWVVGAGAVAILLVVGTTNARDLDHVHLRLDPIYLVAALPFYGLCSLLLAAGWREELSAFGHRLPLLVAIRLWWRAQLARYIPSGLAAVASREVLARDVGVPNMVGAASLAVELATVLGWGSLAAAIGLPSSVLAGPLRLALGAAAAAGLLLLPVVYPPLARLGRRIPMLDALASTPCNRPVMYRAIGVYGGSILSKSVCFVLFASALVSTRAGDGWLLGGAVQGAAVIGLIGLTPAGLGVREASMIAILSPRFGTGDAAALAVAWRAWEFSFELAWLGFGTVVRPRAGAPT